MSRRGNQGNHGSGGSHARIYTDGSCPSNGRDGAQGGIGVYWGEGDSRNVSQPLSGRQTNNRAEIQAAVTGLNQAREQGYRSVTIATDSQFMVDSATKWVPGWKANDWTRSNGESVVNKEDFQALERASEGMRVDWEKVPAHSGDPGNEGTDCHQRV